MRRFVLSLIAACGITVLAACGSGTGFSTGINNNPSVDRVVFTNGSAQVDDFFVSPTGNAPIQISATGYKNGLNNVIVPDAVFTWSATYAAEGTPYPKGPSPNGNGTCGVPSATTAIMSLLQQGSSGQPFGQPTPFYFGFSQLIDAANPVGTTPNYLTTAPSYSQKASTIFVGPPLALDTNGLDTDTAILPLTPSTNYCLVVTATGNGATANVLVVVSNSP